MSRMTRDFVSRRSFQSLYYNEERPHAWRMRLLQWTAHSCTPARAYGAVNRRLCLCGRACSCMSLLILLKEMWNMKWSQCSHWKIYNLLPVQTKGFTTIHLQADILLKHCWTSIAGTLTICFLPGILILCTVYWVMIKVSILLIVNWIN